MLDILKNFFLGTEIENRWTREKNYNVDNDDMDEEIKPD
jgi:hypothetical protein